MEVSFFFSNFIADHNERDMWMIFHRRGRVKDVFISSRLNVKRKKFGFVRFEEVVGFNKPKYRTIQEIRKCWV